ncbi:hypothetical protein GF362_06100 [Candidatus Dojkabacteria bacterium]|nr:hypothetical protein [Candidatus Dojkabacteria bacterium]
MRKFAKKLAAGAAVVGLLAGSLSPVLAAGDLPIYPDTPPANGARISVTDAQVGGVDDAFGDLETLFMDMNLQDGKYEYDLGVLPVYGNDQDDENGEDSFSTLQVELDDTGTLPLTEYAFIAKDGSNTNKPVYNITSVVNAPADLTVCEYTIGDDTIEPGEGFGTKVENFVDDAKDDGDCTTVGYFDGNDIYDPMVDEDTLTSTVSITGVSGNVHKGDPDYLHYYLDEVFFFQVRDGDEYAYRADVELGEAMQDHSTEGVQGLRAVARGSRGRLEWRAPEDPSGIVGYQINLDNGTGDQLTHQTVVFFETNPGTDYDVEVATLNGEGDEGVVEEASADSEIEDIDSELSDIADYYFRDYIRYLYNLSIIDGYPDGTYRGEEPVTRAQLAKFVYNGFKLPFDMSAPEFPDIDTGHSLYTYVMLLASNGVVKGYSDGTFRPDEPVLRQQAALYFLRAATYYDEDVLDLVSSCGFPDLGGLGSEAQTAVCTIASHGDGDFAPIMSGYSDGNFYPERDLTRGQMAKGALGAASTIERKDLTADDDPSFINILPAEGLDECVDDDGAEPNVVGADYVAHGADEADTDSCPVGTPDGTDDYQFDFIRPFWVTAEVEDLEEDEVSTAGVQLAWDDMSNDDPSIDGYMVYRREVMEDETEEDVANASWDVLEGNYGYEQSETQLSIADGTAATAGSIEVTVDGNEVETTQLAVGATDDDAANAIANAINDIDGFTATATGGAPSTVDVVSDVRGVDFTVQISANPTGLVIAPPTVIVDVATSATGVQLLEGFVPVEMVDYLDANGYGTDVLVTDNDVDAEDKYEYKVVTVKFIPFPFSETDDYASMNAMLDDVVGDEEDTAENLVMSSGMTQKVSVPSEEEL